MNYVQFAQDSDVQQFVEWFCLHHGSLHISLDIKSTRYVPNGLEAQFTGFSTVLDYYRWKSVGMRDGSWVETSAVLGNLSDDLTRAVDSGDAPATRKAVRDILRWGGNRNWKVGAWSFISKMDDATLVSYLRQTRAIFSLHTAQTPIPAGPQGVQLMNAMLTKVHALNSSDGLPIYDSRVAAAIACLIEMWRMQSGLESKPLPHTLSFPSTDPARTVTVLSETALAPPMMTRVTTPSQSWSDAKVRLGWLIQLILAEDRELFADLSARFPALKQTALAAGTRAHAFESVLFMLGYNPACLLPEEIAEQELNRRQETSVKQGASGLSKSPSAYPFATTTLTGTEENVRYEIAEGSYNVLWGNSPFSISEERVSEILELIESSGNGGILLASSQDGNPPRGSLGAYLKESGYNPRIGSAIAAILRDQRLIEARGAKGIRLFGLSEELA